MKQLTQKLKDGSMDVLDVATPNLGNGMVLVQNHYSLISAGTEGGTASTARKGLIGKAKERPQQVKQVVDTLKQQGPVQTYRAVMKKLDSYSPLGYSSAGVVVAVAPDVRGFTIGDKVACAGAGYANHAEVVSVPANLCVKLQNSSDLSLAAYNTLGAIAMQGVRQADLRVGETCVIIGLGLLGQLTGLILKASGINVIGLDINTRALEIASKHSIDLGFEMNSSSITDAVEDLSNGIGADAVIITAATSSTQPINLAGKLLRKRGTVVVVGDVPTGFDREPDYYKKELSLKMSCSYGPGRYDIDYEEKGIDYPAGYVRWTENRNMQAFQDLIHSGKIDISYLTTHRYSIDEAPKAYDLIVNKSEEFLGIIIEYNTDQELSNQPVFIDNRETPNTVTGTHGIGFVGAGSYAMSHLLPNLPKDDSVAFTGVMTSSGTSSRSVAEKFGFSFCASSAQDVINNSSTNTVFIATRHDTHAEYVNSAISAGKNVFVEKPLCLNQTELDEIVSAWNTNKPILMVGFNRRFSPLAQQIKSTFGDGRMAMIYRVNAGQIPADTWIQDDKLGGGRVVGEVCHFIDFMIYLNGSLPTQVHATALDDKENLGDTLNINLTFSNGSIGTICYFANGPKTLAKEYIEVYKGGVAALLHDFKELEILSSGGKKARKKLLNQDKGQSTMVEEFILSIKGESPCPISLNEIYSSTLVTFKILESLRTGQAISIDQTTI
jgi:polar amino acid transport system substrate-binding protein